MDGGFWLKLHIFFLFCLLQIFPHAHADELFQYNVVLNANQFFDQGMLEDARKNCREILNLAEADVQVQQQSKHIVQIKCFAERQAPPVLENFSRPQTVPESEVKILSEKRSETVEKIDNVNRGEIQRPKERIYLKNQELRAGLGFVTTNYFDTDGKKLNAALNGDNYQAQLGYHFTLSPNSTLGVNAAAGNERFIDNDREIINDSTFRKGAELEWRKNLGLKLNGVVGMKDRSGISKATLEALTISTALVPYLGGSVEMPIIRKGKNHMGFGVEYLRLMPASGGGMNVEGGNSWKLYVPWVYQRHNVLAGLTYATQNVKPYESSYQALGIQYAYLFGGR